MNFEQQTENAPKVAISFKASPASKVKIAEFAERNGQSVSEFCEMHILDACHRLAIDGESWEAGTLIEEIHYSLHPKITLVGPLGGGKTTIAERLAKKGELTKEIMDFAVVHKVQLGSLYFDLWDFVLDDDFSPLWGNYIRGSDLVVFVFNSFEKKHRKIENFLKGDFKSCCLSTSTGNFFKESLNEKVLPIPSSLFTQISPFISFTSCLEILRPSPVPPKCREVDVSA